MVNKLSIQKSMASWGLEIEQDPISLDSFVLTAPQMLLGNQIIQCSEQAMKRAPIHKPQHLK